MGIDKTPELEKRNFVLYYDGSSSWEVTRVEVIDFLTERNLLKNYEEITKGLGGEAVYLVSHSEGGAFAAGVADYLYSKDIKLVSIYSCLRMKVMNFLLILRFRVIS